MVQALMIGFSLFLAIGLVVAGFLWNKKGRTSALLTSGGALIALITGLFILLSPLEFVTGTTTQATETTTYIYYPNMSLNQTITDSAEFLTYDYTPLDTRLNNTLGATLVIMGLFGIITGLRGAKDNEEIDEWEDFSSPFTGIKKDLE